MEGFGREYQILVEEDNLQSDYTHCYLKSDRRGIIELHNHGHADIQFNWEDEVYVQAKHLCGLARIKIPMGQLISCTAPHSDSLEVCTTIQSDTIELLNIRLHGTVFCFQHTHINRVCPAAL